MWLFSRDPLKDFPYEIGNIASSLEEKSIWTLHEGKKRVNGEIISIFSYDVKSGNEEQLQLVKATMKRMKTLRHPNILTYIDGLESEKSCLLVTEPVKPLLMYLEEIEIEEAKRELIISWGFHQIVKGLYFLNEDCSIVHANINPAAVFVDSTGEWKLGGFEFSFHFSSDRISKNLPALLKYNPPEFSSTSKNLPTKWSEDAWGLGCFIWEVFNGSFPKNSMLKNPGKIPKNLSVLYISLINPNPKSRINPGKFLEDCLKKDGFMDNKFVYTMVFLENIQIKDQDSKTKFFNELSDILDSIPSSFCKLKILPQLIHAFEFGNAGSAVLTPLFKLGRLLDSDEYQKRMVPCVVKLFSSTDRATRVKLLQQMECFIEYLSHSIINKEIFPSVATGFLDSNPMVREQTIKSMLHLAPKLDYKNLNEEILKHFSRLQAKDEQGGIRTNTTVCLGKIACYLNPQVRQRVLTSAFLRAFKDPFPQARQAGILALAATHNFFYLQEIAYRILPSLVSMTLDPDKIVRDHVFKTIKCFIGKLENLSEHPEQREELEKDVLSGAVGASSSTAGWAGWAFSGMSTLTSKIYSSKQNYKQNTIHLTKNVLNNENSPEYNLENSNTIGRKLSSSAQIKSCMDTREIKSFNVSDEEEDWGEGWKDIEIDKINKMTPASVVKSSPNKLKENYEVPMANDDNWGEMTETLKDEFIADTTGHATASSYNWDAYNSVEPKLKPDDDYFFNSMLLEKNSNISNTNNFHKLNVCLPKNTHPDTLTANCKTPTTLSKTTATKAKIESSSDDWENDAWGALDEWAQEDSKKVSTKAQSRQSVKNK